MPGFLDVHVLMVPCQKCSHKTMQNIAWLKTGPDLTCPKCGEVTPIDATDFRRKIEKAEQTFADLGNKISKTINLDVKS